MSRKLEQLTLDHLPELGAGCGRCAYWQLDPVRRHCAGAAATEDKSTWLSMMLREWGSCGRVLLIDGQLVGHMIWAPPVFVPGAAGFVTSPVSDDAVVIVGGYVHPLHRGHGLGRQLVQVMAKDLVKRRDVKAVEAFGGLSGCTLPTEFLLSVGFRTYRRHAVHPRMRMDLRSTVRVREELEHAFDRLLDRLPRPSVAPGQQATNAPHPPARGAALRPQRSVD